MRNEECPEKSYMDLLGAKGLGTSIRFCSLRVYTAQNMNHSSQKRESSVNRTTWKRRRLQSRMPWPRSNILGDTLTCYVLALIATGPWHEPSVGIFKRLGVAFDFMVVWLLGLVLPVSR